VANYHYTDDSYCFIEALVESKWIDETNEHSTVKTYRNPFPSAFEAGAILTLPTGFNRPVQFITPYWVEAGVIAFNYWFYIQDKQLVSYTGTELIWTDVDTVVDKAFDRSNSVFTFTQRAVLYVGGSLFVDEDGNPINDIDDEQPCAEMQQEIDSRDSRIKELEDSLLRVERKLKLIQHKEVQYENQRKNFKIAWLALRQNAPHICKDLEPHLLETIEYDKMVSPILVENLEKEGVIIHLKDVLLDILNCASTMSNDEDDEWGWLWRMASLAWEGEYYDRDTMLPRFGIGEFPKHILPITDEI
jgi:hypothetical protein